MGYEEDYDHHVYINHLPKRVLRITGKESWKVWSVLTSKVFLQTIEPSSLVRRTPPKHFLSFSVFLMTYHAGERTPYLFRSVFLGVILHSLGGVVEKGALIQKFVLVDPDLEGELHTGQFPMQNLQKFVLRITEDILHMGDIPGQAADDHPVLEELDEALDDEVAQ